jgi:hypothetical protein
MNDQMLVTYYLVNNGFVVEMWKRPDGTMYRITIGNGIRTHEDIKAFVTFLEQK